MLDMQSFFDSLSSAARSARAEYGLTLGRFIRLLEELPQDGHIIGLGDLHSYRGYYADLAFEPSTHAVSVAEMLNRCRAALDQTFTGYKGGDFLMGDDAPLWISSYGTASGIRLMDLRRNGALYEPVTYEPTI